MRVRVRQGEGEAVRPGARWRGEASCRGRYVVDIRKFWEKQKLLVCIELGKGKCCARAQKKALIYAKARIVGARIGGTRKYAAAQK